MDDKVQKPEETQGKPRPPARVVEEVVENQPEAPTPQEPRIVSELKKDPQETELASPPGVVGDGPDSIGVEPPVEEKPKRNIKLILLVVVVVAVVVAALGGGIYVYTTGTKKSENSGTEDKMATSEASTPTPTPIESGPTQTPTQAPKRELTNYKLQVLNGSGLIGAASKAKDLLEKNGFKVEEVANASSYDFEKTVIQVKKGVPIDIVDTLKDVLSKNYSVEVGGALEEKSSFDLVVTVGSK